MATILTPQTTLFLAWLLANDFDEYFSENIKATRNELPQAPNNTFTFLLAILCFFAHSKGEFSTLLLEADASASHLRHCIYHSITAPLSLLNQLSLESFSSAKQHAIVFIIVRETNWKQLFATICLIFCILSVPLHQYPCKELPVGFFHSLL